MLPVYTASFALDLGGGVIQRVRQLSGCNQTRFDVPPLPCRVELQGVPIAETMNWLDDSLADPTTTRNVALLEFVPDGSSSVRTRLSLHAARVTRIALTDLDGSTNDITNLVIDLEGDLVRSAGTGSVTFPPAPTGLRRNNFRVTLGDTVLTQIVEVKNIATFDTRNVGLTLVSALSGNGDGLLRDWSDEAVAGGTRTLKIELLNPALTQVLLTITATLAAPLGYPEPFGVGGTLTSGQRVRVDVGGRIALS